MRIGENGEEWGERLFKLKSLLINGLSVYTLSTAQYEKRNGKLFLILI